MRTWIPRPPVVLVVDDAPDVVTLLGMLLAAEGCVVREALGPQEALEKLEGVDVAIVDQQLPGMTGSEMIEVARRQGTRCRFLVISASEASRAAAERAGAHGFMAKPLDIRELLERVGKLFAAGPTT